MNYSNNLSEFLENINVNSNIKKEFKEFTNFTVIAYYQQINAETLENEKVQYVVELLIAGNNVNFKKVIYDGTDNSHAMKEYEKLVDDLNNNEEYFSKILMYEKEQKWTQKVRKCNWLEKIKWYNMVKCNQFKEDEFTHSLFAND